MTVLRYDEGTTSGVKVLKNGYLRCDGTLTRVGVFPYMMGDGSMRRELRLPDEVFSTDSIDSFDLAPLTNGHPLERGAQVHLGADNTAKFQVGTVSKVSRNDSLMSARLQITDKHAIEDVQGGKRQLSCGYHCDVEMKSGITKGIDGIPDGLHFDAIQRNIRGNHVAIVSKGRAGDTASLRLDAADAVMVKDEQTRDDKTNAPGVKPMKVLKIDGVDFEMSEQAVQAVAKIIEKTDAADEKVKSLLSDVAKEKARADKAEEDVAELQKKFDAAIAPEAVQAAVAGRLSLEREASKILGTEVKLDEMSGDDIKKAVVVKVSPSAEAKLDGADLVYLQARYDAAIESADKADDDVDKAARSVGSVRPSGKADDGTSRTDSVSARAAMIQRNLEMGRKPLHAQG